MFCLQLSQSAVKVKGVLSLSDRLFLELTWHCGQNFQFLFKFMRLFLPSKSMKIWCKYIKPLPISYFLTFQPIKCLVIVNFNYFSFLFDEKRPHDFWTEFEKIWHNVEPNSAWSLRLRTPLTLQEQHNGAKWFRKNQSVLFYALAIILDL